MCIQQITTGYKTQDNKMNDIFDAMISCRKCNILMAKIEIAKDGIRVRAVECPKCRMRIIHPEDKNKLEHFKDLKGRTFSVKLRMVGNSHAISIPKEIVEFMHAQESEMNKVKRHFDSMVKLCFEDFGRLRVDFFNDDGEDEDEDENEDEEEDMHNVVHEDLNHDDVHKIALKRIKRQMKNENKN